MSSGSTFDSTMTSAGSLYCVFFSAMGDSTSGGFLSAEAMFDLESFIGPIEFFFNLRVPAS